ncbi:MAG: Swt1 family HEPN domain-containing protein [Candidatus Anammoxibacter sp.]
MGILFIAAGKFSKNREKTLEKGIDLSELSHFVDPAICESLRAHFPNGTSVYVWGANDRSVKHVMQIRPGEYAVDVCNKKVIQIFTFCFWFKTVNTRLQEHLGWDSEKPKDTRRPYKYVYFLKDPRKTQHDKKEYFQTAFGESSNPQWLVGQRYFNDEAVLKAMERTRAETLEHILGLFDGPLSMQEEKGTTLHIAQQKSKKSNKREQIVKKKPLRPKWLMQVINAIETLQADPIHPERQHEELVAQLFEALGYQRITDIKYQRGRIDIRIDKDGVPLITIEVKKDWNLGPEHSTAVKQLFGYAMDIGTRYAILTNGDRYCLYDQDKGRSFAQKLYANFSLSELDDQDLVFIEGLRKEKQTLSIPSLSNKDMQSVMITGKMTELLMESTKAISNFLNKQLPKTSSNWWNGKVLPSLTERQRDHLYRRKDNKLEQLDLAALLRVITRNWKDISARARIPYEVDTYFRELGIIIRNRWAHTNSEGVPLKDVRRDIDTIKRIMTAIKADEGIFKLIESIEDQL